MKNTYKTYRKDVQKFMHSTEKYLANKYGSVEDEWNTTLMLMADNLELYYQCKDSIKANGIFDKATYKKNPLLSTCKDLQATLIKEIQHLGLTPYASSKIGSLNQEGQDSDLLKNLMGMDDD